ALGGGQVAGQQQAAFAEREQQLHLVQSQGRAAALQRLGQLVHAVLEQRGALADAEHFVAQHAVGGVGLRDALRLRAVVATQTVHARLEVAPVRVVGQRRRRALALQPLPVLPAPPAKQRQQQQREQPGERVAAAWRRG